MMRLHRKSDRQRIDTDSQCVSGANDSVLNPSLIGVLVRCFCVNFDVLLEGKLILARIVP